MARNWRDVRAEAVAAGRVDPERANAARRQMLEDEAALDGNLQSAVEADKKLAERAARYAVELYSGGDQGEVEYAIRDERTGRLIEQCGCCFADWVFDTRLQAEKLIEARGEEGRYTIVSRPVLEWEDA